MMHFKMPREFYIPKGAVKVSDKQSDAVAYVYTQVPGRFSAAIFFGKQAKPYSKYYYRTEAQRDGAIASAFEARRTTTAYKAERQAKRKAFVHSYKVGDLFRRSWGYDQTNVDYYEVTEVSGRMVTVREIGQVCVETGNMCGQTTPQPGKFTGEPKRCLAQDGSIKINHYGWAYYHAPKMVAGVPTYGTDYYSAYA